MIRVLQFHLEGLDSRKIENIMGISHSSIVRWIKKYAENLPRLPKGEAVTKNMNAEKLAQYLGDKKNIEGRGLFLTSVDGIYSVVTWEDE